MSLNDLLKKTVIILPVYNEVCDIENFIRLIFDEKFKDSGISVVVVESNSTDGSREILENLQKEYKNLKLLRQNEKKGLASAYIDGFEYAKEQNFEIFVQMDADFQHPLNVLTEMIEQTEKNDLIIGSRYVANGSWANENFVKYLISVIGNIYAKNVLKCPINDLTGGYNVWTKNAVEKINFENICSKGFLFQVEMKYKTYKNNLKILEYPINFNPRKNGKTKMNKNIIVEGVWKIWKIKNFK